MRTRVICSVLFLSVVLGLTASAADWYNDAWWYRQEITVDSSQVTGDVTDFPLLVCVTNPASGLWAKAHPDGTDILFTSSNGTTKVSHQLETYDPVTSQLWAWVKVPLLSSSEDTVLYMYYGNYNAANQENATNVWDGDYAMVYHMDETNHSASAYGEHLDSTANSAGLHEDKYVDESLMNVAGKIGIGDAFNGGNGSFYSASGVFTPSNSFTESLWVYPTNSITAFLAYKHGGSLGLWQSTSGWRGYFKNGSDSTLYSAWQFTTITLHQWYHLAVTYNGSDLKLYVDGVEEDSQSEPGWVAYDPYYVRVGKKSGPVGEYELQGRLDEIRFSDVARSADWIKASYDNQMAPSAFMSFAAEEAGPASTAADAPIPASLLAWSFRQRMDIERSAVVGDLTDFPLLVTEANVNASFWDHVQDDGDDVVFTSSDGETRLKYEIEDFDWVNKEMSLWVKIPFVDSVISDTPLYVYYGNSSVGSQADAANVWDSNFKLVLHLDESPDDDVYGHIDSSGNGNDGRPRRFQDGDGGTTDAQGMIDGANFWGNNPGKDDIVEVPDDPSLDITGQITLGAWVRYSELLDSIFYRIVEVPSPYIRRENSGRFRGVFVGLSDDNCFSTTAPVTDTWYYVVGVYDGSYIRMYVNGIEEDSDPSTGTLNTYGSSTLVGNGHNGEMDEVRVSDVARSAAWIKASYDNQNSPAGFLVAGAETSIPRTGTLVLLR